MGYQALLFCPDEKTARTVTQVLGELEFTVEACSEPFAAVKKLMGEHFDAVVVDCDNEQNATLLFKSARNSTSNQTSLAVAVVEGQAGVAKAFRIGANLVLTKPINIEQTKGTLRVARGLLRKGDPAKPGAPAAAPSPAAAPPSPAAAAPVAKPVAKPTLPPKPAAPVAAKPAAPPVPRQIPVEKPVSAAPAASMAPATQTAESFPAVTPSLAVEAAAAVPPAVVATPRPTEAASAPAAPFAAPSFSTAGAASAPAPAREPELPRAVQQPVESVPAPAKIESAFGAPSPIAGSAPTFSYGGSSDAQSGGGTKKIFIGIAAGVALAIAGYFGWSHFSAHSTSTAPTATTEPAGSTTQPIKSDATQPAQVPATTATTTQPVETSRASSATSVPEANEAPAAPKETPSRASAKAEKTSSAASKQVREEQAEPEPAPLVVKGGKGPAANTKSATADAAAPSLIGMASPTEVPPTGLVPSTNPTFKPVLQRVSVSQGVSQGLLYKKVPPSYPSSALRMRIEGKVELMATISKEGNITQVKILSGDGQLSKAAADAVKQWKYKPYLLNGEPVEIQTEITVNFKLPN